MRKINLIIVALLLSFLTAKAQTASIENVLNLKFAQHTGEIMQDRKLVGYYVFYFKEKVDKKNSAYEIEVYDDNYNPTANFEIVRPKNSALIQMVFNGEVFMLHFYDSKVGYEFVTFDKQGNKMGSTIKTKKEISKYDLAGVNQSTNSSSEYISIFPNGKNGFIRSTWVDNDKVGYEIVAYDNNAEEKWKFESLKKSELHEYLSINEVNGGIVSTVIAKKKKNLSNKDVQMFCMLLNAENGELISEFELGNEAKGYLSVLKSAVNPAKSSIFILGEFYKPNDDILKDKSLGLYLQELNMNGEEISMKKYKWKGDIDKFKASKDPEDKNSKDPFYAIFHDVILSKNGHVFVIGEQFKKQISATGIAAKLLVTAAGGDASGGANTEIRVKNMIVLEFDENKDLIDFTSVEKKHTTIMLPAEYSFSGTTLMGNYIKAVGGFDYSFSSKNVDDDHFQVVYYDYNRKEDEKSKSKSDVMLGVISIKNGELSQTRVPINTDAKSFWIQPAKTGYISISEYYKKEKRVDMRLEQLTY